MKTWNIVDITSEHDVIGRGHIIVIDPLANNINAPIRTGDILQTSFSRYEVRNIEIVPSMRFIACIVKLLPNE